MCVCVCVCVCACVCTTLCVIVTPFAVGGGNVNKNNLSCDEQKLTLQVSILTTAVAPILLVGGTTTW